MIKKMMFAQRAEAAPGEVYFYHVNRTWTVPEGVFSICAVAQQYMNSTAISLTVSGVIVLRAKNGLRIGDGGGDGGLGGATTRGGGGGGGYTGNGGDGGLTQIFGIDTYGLQGANGVGGGGGGGGGPGVRKGEYPAPDTNYFAGTGGGVGLMGIGANGTGGGGADPASGTNGVSGAAGSPDARYGNTGGGVNGYDGGALSWANNIPVTPGQVLTLASENGRIRIFWGGGRSFPSNAGYL